MKKLILIVMALMMVLALVACGNTTNTPTNPTSSSQPASTEPTGTNPPIPNIPVEDTPAKEGVAYSPFNNDLVPTYIKGIKLRGNVLGSTEFDDGRDYSLTDIRCIFELDEWIDFELNIEETDEPIFVYVIDGYSYIENYQTCTIETVREHYYAFAELTKDPDSQSWGNLYVNPDDANPGMYGIAFFVGTKLDVVVPVRFYKTESELLTKTDDELNSIMAEFKN